MSMLDADAHDMRILVVDDNAANLSFVQQMLAAEGYTDVATSLFSLAAVTACELRCPDLLILDLRMPVMDGFGVLVRLEPLLREPVALPVLVVTADANPDTRRQALALGARDFVTKPLDRTEVSLRVRNLLQTRRLQLKLQAQNSDLAQRVAERTANLDIARRETLQRLAVVAEYRDHGTHEHARRIGRNAELLALALGVPADEARLIADAAPLHDIGKIGIPDRILLKPSGLSDEEWAVMQSHTTIGARMLAGGTCPIIHAAEPIARWHHERLDGTGYPDGRVGDEIPLAARIVAVVDVYDALTHDRPYKSAWSPTDALLEICASEGQFDLAAVEALALLDPARLLAPIRDRPLEAPILA